MENKEKLIFRFETPYNNTLWNNRGRYLLNSVIGDPNSYPNNHSESQSAFVRCIRCSGVYFWDSIIIVRYGEQKYSINIYCYNCFERMFPRWKRFLINHFSYFKKKYREIEPCPYTPFCEFNLKHYKDDLPTFVGVPLVFSGNKRYPKKKDHRTKW